MDHAALTQLRDDLLVPKHAWQYSNPAVQGQRVEVLERGLAAVIEALNPPETSATPSGVDEANAALRDPTSGIVLEEAGPSIARDTLESA